MSNIETYTALDQISKLDQLFSQGELIVGYRAGQERVYDFLLNDFFVSLHTSDENDESVMVASNKPSHLDKFLDETDLIDFL